MAALVFTLIFALPLLALGAFLVWLSSASLRSYLFGGPRDDPFQWPEVPGTVLAHRVDPEYRGNRIDVTRGPDVENMQVYVTVRLPAGQQAELIPAELANMPVWQPPHMDFGTFMREVDSLALAQAQQTLPVGSTVMLQTDPARRGFKGRTGIHWTSASDRRVTASKPLSLLVMLFLLGFGVFMLLLSGAMLWASTSGALSR